jgi:hypothetical protein
MKRRDFIMLIGGAALARPVAAQAQRPARIGFPGFGTAAATADRVEALRAGLRDLGYLEGKNLACRCWARMRSRGGFLPGRAARGSVALRKMACLLFAGRQSTGIWGSGPSTRAQEEGQPGGCPFQLRAEMDAKIRTLGLRAAPSMFCAGFALGVMVFLP